MSGQEWVDLFAKVLFALGSIGGIGAFFMVRAQKRKILAESSRTDAEAESIVADAQAKRTQRELNLLAAYERGVDDLTEKLDRANDKIDRLTQYVEMLVTVIRDAGMSVPPMPPIPPTTHPRMFRVRGSEDPNSFM
jgi:hypothetical protein